MKIRAYPKDLPEAERTPDKMVYGQHLNLGKTHWLVLDEAILWGKKYEPSDGYLRFEEKDIIEIDIATAAEDTCRDDKNGNRIFGSREDMLGGDRMRVTKDGAEYHTIWYEYNGQWMFDLPSVTFPMCDYLPDELEIIHEHKE